MGIKTRAVFLLALLGAATPVLAQTPGGSGRAHARALLALTPETASALRARAEAGEAEAMALLGQAYGQGIGGLEVDDEKAVFWLRRAAAAGYSGTGRILSFFEFRLRERSTIASAISTVDRANRLLKDGVNDDDRPALLALVHDLTRLAALGIDDAQVALGDLYAAEHGVGQDWPEAARWYRAAAALGNASAMHALGVLMEEGRGVAVDHTAATRQFVAAAALGHGDSQIKLAVLSLRGEFGPVDPVEALKWLILAASGGNTAATDPAERLAAALSPEQVSQAMERARVWRRDQGR